MAKLPDETITSALNLQRRLLEGIDAAKAAESAIFEQSGDKLRLMRQQQVFKKLKGIGTYYERAKTTSRSRES